MSSLPGLLPSGSTNFGALPSSAASPAAAQRNTASQSTTPLREQPKKKTLIDEIIERALRLPAPPDPDQSTSPSGLSRPFYYPPQPLSSNPADHAHILRATTSFRALIPRKKLEDGTFTSEYEGILYNHAIEKTEIVAISILHPDKEHLRTRLNQVKELQKRLAQAILTSPDKEKVFIAEPQTSFGPIYTSRPYLCNILEAKPEENYSSRQLLEWIEEVGNTLSWLHLQGVVHGEVTPENIVLMKDKTDPNAPPKAYLRGFDFFSSSFGYSQVGVGLEDPCSHLSIAMPLTDIYGFVSTLAILFSDSKKPITADFLKKECEKYISEYLEKRKIDVTTPSTYPFETMLKLICYEQLSVIFHILRNHNSQPFHYVQEKELCNGARNWQGVKGLTGFTSLRELMDTYPGYESLFTSESIKRAEKNIAINFGKERLPLVRIPDLLAAARQQIRAMEASKRKQEEELKEATRLLFPAQSQAIAREQEMEMAMALLAPARTRLGVAGAQAAEARPATANQAQPPPSEVSSTGATESLERFSLRSKANARIAEALRTEALIIAESRAAEARRATTTKFSQIPPRGPISPRAYSIGARGAKANPGRAPSSSPPPSTPARTSAPEYVHLGSPPRLRRRDTPAPASRQPVQSLPAHSRPHENSWA